MKALTVDDRERINFCGDTLLGTNYSNYRSNYRTSIKILGMSTNRLPTFWLIGVRYFDGCPVIPNVRIN